MLLTENCPIKGCSCPTDAYAGSAMLIYPTMIFVATGDTHACELSLTFIRLSILLKVP